MEMPVYLFTGLLESGKTTLIHEVVNEEEDFLEPGTTLLIKCEEGEATYSDEFLSSNNIVLIEVDEQEQLNSAFWQKCEAEYTPAQIMIEYNGEFPKTYEEIKTLKGKSIAFMMDPGTVVQLLGKK